MIASPVIRYFVSSTAVALSSGVFLTAVLAGHGLRVVFWMLFGWVLMVLPAVIGGARMTSLLGTHGAGFIVALGASMLARLAAAAVGAGLAAWSGGNAIFAFVAGLLAGFLPLQAFEVIWFFRQTRHPVAAGGER